MSELRTSRAAPGMQQNWEICDHSCVNMIVVYARSAEDAISRAARLLSISPDQLRAKPLPSHATLPGSARSHVSACTWSSSDDEV